MVGLSTAASDPAVSRHGRLSRSGSIQPVSQNRLPESVSGSLCGVC
ncbi:hypothetical protein HMPREF9371_1565 [Neisseria shayeganii 871]|uniref:Uncharacterized protein n=1 Tax=Neisseria shayeganii 871 TaxID=1032488 RepID=G4CIX6_9NEIS|nr:hypothetical protein HMPREF9371_1565 [Neisseria shayeganii 871]